MLGGRSTYLLGGAFSDGKGQPAQSNSVSHGCPVATVCARQHSEYGELRRFQGFQGFQGFQRF